MKHDYTDEEIRTAWKDALSLREFLDALPERPQPWPGQQEAIDAAFQQIDEFYLDYKSSHDDWNHEAPARLAIAQAYDAARPQAAEIAELKAELEKTQAELRKARKHLEDANRGAERNAHINSNFASQLIEARKQAEQAKAELAALRQPILADDGRRLGQVAMKASFDADTEGLTVDECYEAAAKAVVAAARPAIEAECLAQAVRRMEDVPVTEMWNIWGRAKSLTGIRARLIAAAKGEGQAVVVNQPPQDEKQPDLSGESERQAEAQPWTPAVGDTVRLKSGGPVMTVVETRQGDDVQKSHVVWITEEGRVSGIESLSTDCLTPAQP